MSAGVGEKRAALIALFANALALLNVGSIGVALPRIASSLGLSADEELWLPDVLVIGVVCGLPLCSYLLRRFGARRLLVTCAAGTAAISAAAAMATDYEMLVALAFLGGLFAAPLAPTTQTLVVNAFEGERRSRGMAFWNAGSMGGWMLGMLGGGWLTSEFSWRAIYLMPVPFALVAIVVCLGAPKRKPGPPPKLDLLGAMLVVLAMLCLGTVLNLGEHLGWLGSSIILGAIGGFAAAAIAFAMHARRTTSPILRLNVLRGGVLAGAAAINLVLAMLITGQLEVDLLGGPLEVGAEMIGLRGTLGGVGMLVGTAIAGIAMPRFGALVVACAGALAIVVGKVGFLTAYAPGLDSVAIIWPELVQDLGVGLLVTTLGVTAFSAVVPERRGDAASVYVLSTWLGQAIGLAGLGAVQANREHVLAESLPAASAAVASYDQAIMVELVGSAVVVIALFLFLRRLASGSTKR